jgi:hypothetical protein
MMEHGGTRDSNEVLVVDSNYTRGHSFLAVLGFIKLEAKLITPEQLPDIPRRELFNYLAIFSIGGDYIANFISGLCFQSDYYSLSQVMDQARKHNKRERRMQNRECQPLIGNSKAIERIGAHNR